MCPKCNNDLKSFDLAHVQVDLCDACKGLWLDSGELGMIAAEVGLRPGRLTQVLGTAWCVYPCNRSCPKCRRRMLVIALGHSRIIELDLCPMCHGMWFDNNEIHETIACLENAYPAVGAEYLDELISSEIGEA